MIFLREFFRHGLSREKFTEFPLMTAYHMTVDLDLAIQHSMRRGRETLRERLKLANRSKSGL